MMFKFHSTRLAIIAAIAAAGGFTMKEADDDDEDDDDDGDRGHRGRRSQTELMEQLVGMIDKRGGGESGAKAIALKLLDDNEKARNSKRIWKEKALELQKTAPKEGQVVLSKEDAAAYEEFKKLGTPAEVKTKVESAAALATEKATREKGDTVAKGAELAKLNPKLLARLAEKEGFVVELRDEKVDGKDVKVPYARKNEEKAATLPLAQFVDKELADYKPALLAKGDGTAASSEQQSHATPYIEQSSTGTAPASGKVDAFIKSRNEQAAARPNPLAPPAPKPAAAATTT